MPRDGMIIRWHCEIGTQDREYSEPDFNLEIRLPPRYFAQPDSSIRRAIQLELGYAVEDFSAKFVDKLDKLRSI